ncbi:MAG: hypothetical protein ACREEM_00455 [Blastocatellia bacterium]
MAKRYTNSAEAWQLYVRGRQLVHKRRIPDIEKAIAYLERAIALDQGFALAHVTLGYAYTSLNYRGAAPAKEVIPKAKAAYDQALRLDDQLAEARASSANRAAVAHAPDLRLSKAAESCEQAGKRPRNFQACS